MRISVELLFTALRFAARGGRQVVVEAGAGDPEQTADIPHRVLFPFAKLACERILRRVKRSGSPAEPAPCSYRAQSCLCPLADEIPLKLRDGPEDVGDEFASRGRLEKWPRFCGLFGRHKAKSS